MKLKPNYPKLSLVAVALVATLSACSFKDQHDDFQTVSIRIPDTGARSSHAKSASAQKGGDVHALSDFIPSTINDFNCFAVNVVAADIPKFAGMSCSSSRGLGVIAGFVPAGTSSVSVQVPNGTGRTIQLIGVQTSNGACPDITQALNSNNANGLSGMSNPYLLATTAIDVSNDMSVDLNASFDPTQPKILFQDCGVGNHGPSYPPTRGYTGRRAGTGFSPLRTHTALPSGAGGIDINGSLITNLASLPLHTETTPGINVGISTTETSPSFRAVVQLQWDVSNLDLTTFPYGRIHLRVRGGQDDACASAIFGARAAVYNQAQAKWMALGGMNYSNSTPSWSWAGAPINVPLSQLVTTQDSSSYIIVNVESNYAALSGCATKAAVAEASLEINKTYSAMVDSGGDGIPRLISLEPQGSTSSTVQKFVSGRSQITSIGVSGGTPPYSYSFSSSSSLVTDNGNSIDATTGFVTSASGWSGTQNIYATDSKNRTGQLQMEVVDSLTIGPLAIIPVFGTPIPAANADGSYDAGTCIETTFKTMGLNGQSPNAVTTITLSLNNSEYFSDTSCSIGISSASISSGQNQTTAGLIYYKATRAGASTLMASSNLTSYFSSMLTSRAYTTKSRLFSVSGRKMMLVGSPYLTEGYCGAYTLQTTDLYGNAVLPDHPENLTISSFPSGFFQDSACGTSLSSIAMPAGSQSVTVYFSRVAVSGVSLGYITSGSADGSISPGGTLNVTAVTTPTDFKVALNASNSGPDGDGCIMLDALTVNSFGNAQNVGSTLTTSVQWPGPVFSTLANCVADGTNSPTLSIMSGTSVTSFWVKPGLYTGRSIWLGNNPTSNLAASPVLTLPQ